MAAPLTAFPLAVLVIDDEKNIRSTLTTCLETLGCKVTEAASADAAKAALGRATYQLAFLDLRLGQASGLDLLPSLLALSPGLDVVVITAYATIETAVETIQRGARDYLPKPFSPAQIRHIVERAIERRQLERRVRSLEAQVENETGDEDLETHSPKMQSLLEVLSRAAAYDVPVLLEGENGTGKSVLARRLHNLSARAEAPFVVVNCPTLSEELLASELFGHARGAFTGAVRDQPGRVESAEGGTLFLDEIGELPPSLQAKLLRFLQDRSFERVGETKTRIADVRMVAATNRHLGKDVESGHFREDLLYRLNTFELTVPPLRERKEDLIALARRFVVFFARRTPATRGPAISEATAAAAPAARMTPELSAEAEAVLLGYSWPGNIRELRNVVERAVILCPAAHIGPEYLPERIAPRGLGAPFVGGDYTIESIEREHLLRVLARTPTLEDAARILGIDPSTLWRRRKKYEEG